MIDFFVAPLEYGFMVRALIGSILVGVMCPLVGAYVVTRNLAFIGDALAHAVLPGMVLGFMAGINPVIVAVPTGVAVSVLVRTVSRRAGLSADTSIGILFATMFALGLVMLGASTTIKINMEDILLGQILAISSTGIYISLGITVMVILGLFTLHHWLLFASFDPVASQVVGARANIVDYAFMVMLALVIVIGVQAAGNRSCHGDAGNTCRHGVHVGQALCLDDDGSRGAGDRSLRYRSIRFLPLQSVRRSCYGSGLKRDIHTGILIQAKGDGLRIFFSKATRRQHPT